MSSTSKISAKDSIATRMLLIIIGLYLVVALSVTSSHIWMEYKYQKESIIQDLEDIEQAFKNGLAVNLWSLDQQALKATVEGMLNIPTLVGVKILNSEDAVIAMGGMIVDNGKTGKVGLNVKISGFSGMDKPDPAYEIDELEIFERQFPITLEHKGEVLVLGQAMIYSNSSIIYRRMKLQVMMLSANVILTLVTFSIALLLVVKHSLRNPLAILTDATQSISIDNLGSFPVDTGASRRNEIKVLEESMNQMMADLYDAIVKRKETESSLRESEKFLGSIFRAAPIGIGVTIDQTLVQLNAQICKMTGYSEGELIGLSAGILYQSSVDYEQTIQVLNGQIQDQAQGSLETCWKRKNGSIINVLMSATPLHRNDATKGITFAALDITERKGAERALEESEKKYRSLFEKTNDAIFIVDKNTGRYLDANESALKLTGRSWAELSQLTTHDVSPKGASERLEQLYETEVLQRFGQTVYVRPDGQQRITNLNAIPLGKETVIGIARDVTEELKLNERLRQSQKMEAIGTLAGGIAHDFNNILSGIFGYCQLAHINIQNPEKAKPQIAQIEKGAQRAAELVQQILTFSRQAEYQKRPFNLAVGVKEALKLLRSSIPSTIEIVKKIESMSAVCADPIRIHQAVMNLCTNAYHAMQKSGGTLTVSLTDVDILESKTLLGKKMMPGKYVNLEVRDTGVGMTKTELGKAFEPYFTTKDKGQGTGLGLALVHAIVDEHEGFLDISTRPGLGSCFSIYFPRISQEAKHEECEDPNSCQIKGNEKIMIVDDEEAIRKSCSLFLESRGYQVQIFKDGLDALEGFKKDSTQIDLIITDLTMPGLTGDKFAKEILKIRPDMPIILCTGYIEEMTKTKVLELGIKKWVQKPFSNYDLVVLIKKILNGEK